MSRHRQCTAGSERAVLLVDNIPEYLDAMELCLPEGCRALRAATVDEAKALAARESPVVAVIDVRLREEEARNRDGLELLKWIRAHHPDAAVMMIGAYRDFEYAAESLMMGAELFLQKPIQPEEFTGSVNKLLMQGR